MEIFKAHGTANDFVVLPDPSGAYELAPAAVVALCDRRTGVGADGLLRLAPGAEGVPHGGSADDHVFMDYRNADGTVAEMCGNGVRVVARHLHDHGWTTETQLRVGTRAGTREVVLHLDDDGTVTDVTVDMGPPAFTHASLPDAGAGGWSEVTTALGTTRFLGVSMGNPHAVVPCAEPTEAPVGTLGPAIATAPVFPTGTNVEFVAVRDATHAALRVWERGVGETMACGTGVCGAVAALVAQGRLTAGADVAVDVPGGRLLVRWDGGPHDPVLLTGPAVEVGEVVLDPAWAATAHLVAPTGAAA